MATSEIELILKQTEKLSADETVTLVQKLMANLRRKLSPKMIETAKTEKPGLVYGKYKNSGGRMSTEEDFKLAEYRFNEDEWK